jgi:hypothetical protein
MLTVHLRINDAETGRPTPVRLRITGPDGTHFAPLGRFEEFPTGRNEAVGGQVQLGRERWFYTDGSCEVPLPAGVPLRVQASKGPEFPPLDETMTLGAGQLSLRFALRRWTNMAADGWVSVDTRCHFLSPHAALLEAAAEGLDVVNLLTTVQPFPSLDGTAYPTAPNLLAFSGQRPALEADGRAVVVNTLNTHPVLGTVALLNSHRPVFPLSFGGDETDDWGVCDWCDQCHRKGGLAVWVDAFEPAAGLVGGEALVAAVLGKIDAIEVTGEPRSAPLLPWVYRLWNAGVPVPLVGSSGKDNNRVALGTMRTYADVAATPERPRRGVAWADWLDAVRAGQSFVTTGPLVAAEADGSRVRAVVRSPAPFEKLELVANGQVIAASGTAEVESPLPEAGWVAARCHAPAGGFAHTSPVAIGSPTSDPAAVAALRKLIARTREWAEHDGRYANPRWPEQLLARCDEATARLGAAP